MKVYMMRHGEALDDIEDCYGGIADFPLTDKGRQQAVELAGRLSAFGLSKIYSSPLKRAKETADILCRELSLEPPKVVDALQERNSYGVLSGVNKDKAKLVFENVLSKLTEKPGYSKEPIPGCELWDDFVIRVRTGFDAAIADAVSSGLDAVGIVTHGKFTQALFEDVLRIPDKIDLKLSALNVLDLNPMMAKLMK